MSRTDLLLNLVKAGSQGDQVAFRRTLEAMVAEERSRQHHVLADRLSQFLDTVKPGATSGLTRPSGDFPHSSVMEILPRRRLCELVLPTIVKDACAELVEEQQRAELLRSHNLEPRHRILMAGPPGTGKTSLAEALAGELDLPLLVVRYESIITSYLGETAIKLARLFEYVRTRRCVLFFDEFDALGKERGDEHETGEIKRVVSSLLLSVDALPSYVIVVAATNHPELLDRAVWRRFQLRFDLPIPSLPELVAWIDRFETRTGIKLGSSRKRLVENLIGCSFAELESFCLDVQRRIVLKGPSAKIKDLVLAGLQQWEARAESHR